jgi:hypothetical protein
MSLRIAMNATVQQNTVVSKLRSIKIVNIGGALDNFVSARSPGSDFINIDLNPGPNTIVTDVNAIDLSKIVGDRVRLLRASNVPFVEGPSGEFVEPVAFVRQAQKLQVQRIVITTGTFSERLISDALRDAGFSVRRRKIHQRIFITARC